MKKNYLKLISSLLVSLLVITGCQKQINEPSSPANTDPQTDQSQSKSDQHGNNNECRLVFATNSDPVYNQDFRFHYNHKGLADKWDITNYGRFTQEYDHSGKVKKSIHTVDGEVIFTIHFFYSGNKLVKEILYFGTGTDIMDEAFYTFNAQGKLIKVQSFINDYVAITKYNPEGNVRSSELSFSGIPVYSLFFKYNKHFKNPYLAIPGIDHNFPYYTPSDFFYSKWHFASLKQLAYDENGDPIVLFEYDPSKTRWREGPRDYPGLVKYFDKLGGNWYPYRYEFENCGRGGNDDHRESQTATEPTDLSAGKANPLMMLLKRNPAKSMKEQVKEFRQQMKNIKNRIIHN